jgi:hypothetical protein
MSNRFKIYIVKKVRINGECENLSSFVNKSDADDYVKFYARFMIDKKTSIKIEELNCRDCRSYKPYNPYRHWLDDDKPSFNQLSKVLQKVFSGGISLADSKQPKQHMVWETIL